MDFDSPRSRSLVISLALLLAGVLALAAGRWIRLDDVDGFGYAETSLPWALLAVILAVAAAGVASRQHRARRAFGASLGLVVVVSCCLGFTNDGFRFVWHRDEGEFFMFVLGLGILAALLIVPDDLMGRSEGPGRARAPASAWTRWTLEAVALVVAVFLAFWLGVVHYEASQCSGANFDGECDLGGLEGLLLAAATLAGGLLLIVVGEVARALRMRRRRLMASVAGRG